MGRLQYRVARQQQTKLYWTAREDFYAPTTDPAVSWARKLILDEERTRAMQPVPVGAPFPPLSPPVSRPASSTESAPESPVIFAVDPDAIARAARQEAAEMYDSWSPAYPDDNLIPPSLRHFFIQGSPAPSVPSSTVTGPFIAHSQSRVSSPPIFYDSRHLDRTVNGAGSSSFLPNTIGVPVVWADTVGGTATTVHRYAVLGPAEAGFVQCGSFLRLTNADTNVVVIRRNHGTSRSKPRCTVIEAEYEVHGTAYVRILLVANLLVHAAFTPEATPNAMFVGDPPAYHLFDQLGASSTPYDYGVSIAHYQRHLDQGMFADEAVVGLRRT
ncbi:hypothetical protein DFH06DRAFT_1350146 [Mycena polygramma]|nr:hypothetical protein DFH06DRAFT_1350146 [Mycena polygramma]